MRPVRRGDAVRVAGAAAGVVLAHTVDYAAVFPDPFRRAHELAATGHAYWHVATVAAAAAGIMAAAVAVARGIAGASRRSSAPALRPFDAVVLQVGLFAGIEVVERVLVGHEWLGLIRQRLFLLGVLLQVAVGVVVALVLWVLERVGRHVVARARSSPPRRSPEAAFAIRTGDSYRTLSILGHRPSRAPPVSV